MCATCGCGDVAGVRLDGVRLGVTVHEHDHDHGPDHALGLVGHGRGHPDESAGHLISLEQKVLAKNDRLAGRNRDWLAAQRIVALNIMSSPGSGKTTLLERTIRETARLRPVAVIEGDQETQLDAARIRATGCDVVQVNTGAGCHLDADMVHRALGVLDPAPGSLVFVENVGNLVCPSLFDLGESAKVVVISVTEGQDKPLKYPHMFAAADLVVVNKTDLLPYVDFDVDVCVGHARSVNPGVEVVALSATTGTGMTDWYGWIASR